MTLPLSCLHDLPQSEVNDGKEIASYSIKARGVWLVKCRKRWGWSIKHKFLSHRTGDDCHVWTIKRNSKTRRRKRMMVGGK
jgi:hypothetical protein